MILVDVHPNVRVFTALLRMLWTFSRNFVDTWRKKGDCWEPVLKCGDKNPRCSHDCSLIAVRKLYWRFANFQISIKTIWLTSAKKQWWDDGVVWRIPGPGPGDCGACAKYSQHCAPSSLAHCTWSSADYCPEYSQHWALVPAAAWTWSDHTQRPGTWQQGESLLLFFVLFKDCVYCKKIYICCFNKM